MELTIWELQQIKVALVNRVDQLEKSEDELGFGYMEEQIKGTWKLYDKVAEEFHAQFVKMETRLGVYTK